MKLPMHIASNRIELRVGRIHQTHCHQVINITFCDSVRQSTRLLDNNNLISVTNNTCRRSVANMHCANRGWIEIKPGKLTNTFLLLGSMEIDRTESNDMNHCSHFQSKEEIVVWESMKFLTMSSALSFSIEQQQVGSIPSAFRC